MKQDDCHCWNNWRKVNNHNQHFDFMFQIWTNSSQFQSIPYDYDSNIYNIQEIWSLKHWSNDEQCSIWLLNTGNTQFGDFLWNWVQILNMFLYCVGASRPGTQLCMWQLLSTTRGRCSYCWRPGPTPPPGTSWVPVWVQVHRWDRNKVLIHSDFPGR